MDGTNTFLGTAMDATDLGTGPSDLPAWLRDVLDRALNASEVRFKRKVASDDAINDLHQVDLKDLDSKECPICYDAYEEEDTTSTTTEKETLSEDPMPDQSHIGQEHMKRIQSAHFASKFNDPSMFMPTDEGGSYSRFPIRNLSTLEPVTMDQAFPGYQKPAKASTPTSHIPVKMPSCDHVFGKSCIIEWFKSNVSCPLCREEVECKDTDPRLAKLSHIRSTIISCFNNPDTMVEHLANNSTNIFNPYRRPFNPSITPLTDSFMHQDWATPYMLGIPRVESREPHMILPRRFVLPEARPWDPFGGEGSTSRVFQTVPNRPTTIISRETPARDSATANEANPTANTQAAQPSSGSSTPGSTPGITPQTRSGGPERRRATNRTNHPYVRPSE